MKKEKKVYCKDCIYTPKLSSEKLNKDNNCMYYEKKPKIKCPKCGYNFKEIEIVCYTRCPKCNMYFRAILCHSKNNSVKTIIKEIKETDL